MINCLSANEQCNAGYAREVSGANKTCVGCVAGKYKETIGDDECTVRTKELEKEFEEG